MVFNHIEMLQLKRYTIFALKASISLISSHNNNTMRIAVKRVTHAISFKGNRYNLDSTIIPNLGISSIVSTPFMNTFVCCTGTYFPYIANV